MARRYEIRCPECRKTFLVESLAKKLECPFCGNNFDAGGEKD
mgnify:CR=1 FL=1